LKTEVSSFKDQRIKHSETMIEKKKSVYDLKRN